MKCGSEGLLKIADIPTERGTLLSSAVKKARPEGMGVGGTRVGVAVRVEVGGTRVAVGRGVAVLAGVAVLVPVGVAVAVGVGVLVVPILKADVDVGVAVGWGSTTENINI